MTPEQLVRTSLNDCGKGIFPEAARSAVDKQTEYEAEDPRPAPIGIVVLTSMEKEGSLFQ